MIAGPKLTRGQYLYLASTIRTIAEGIILGSSAAYFLPEALQLKENIAPERYLLLFSIGLLNLVLGAILYKQGET